MKSPLRCCVWVCAAVLLGICSACGGHSNGDTAPQPAPLTIEDQLAELDALPLPRGVDSLLWTQLKGEMKKILLEQNKVSSAAPSTDASQTELSYDSGTGELQWLFFSQGDYDQNGEVNISDITPIALNFGESSGGGSFAVGTIESVIDGDGNGEINIADLTPIGINFGRRVGSYNIYKSTSADDLPDSNTAANGAGALLVGNVALTTAVGDTAVERLSLAFELGPLDPATFYWVRPNDSASGDGADGTPSTVIDSSSFNQLPEPVLFIFGVQQEAPADFIFNIGDSADPDGTIELLELDFEGDGIFDQQFEANPVLVEYTYTNPGFFEPVLRVTDNDGATAEVSSSVSVSSPDNAPPTVELLITPDVGVIPIDILFEANASDPDGTVVRYDWDLDGDGLYEVIDAESSITRNYVNAGEYMIHVRVIDNEGGVQYDIEPLSLTDTENLAPLASLHADVTSGERPLLVHFDASASTDTDGTIARYIWDFQGDGDDDLITTEPFAEWTYSLKAVFNPAVTVEDNDQQRSIPDNVEIEVTKGWQTTVVHPNVEVRSTRLVTVEDAGLEKPVVAYLHANPSFQVIYSYLGSTGGDSFGSNTLVSADGGEYFDMFTTGGIPAVVHSNNGVNFVLADDTAASAWGSEVSVDAGSSLGAFGVAGAEVNGRPAVAYSNGLVAPLFRRATADNGSTWGDAVLAALDSSGTRPKLIVSGGVPCILADPFSSDALLLFSGIDENGSAFDQNTLPTNNVHSDPGFAVIDGKPAITYRSNEMVMFQSATDAQGTSWNEAVIAFNPGVGHYVAGPVLAEINGVPGIAFLHMPTYQLWYVEANNNDGTDWKAGEFLDGRQISFESLDIVEFHELPAISYRVTLGQTEGVSFTYVPQEGIS